MLQASDFWKLIAKLLYCEFKNHAINILKKPTKSIITIIGVYLFYKFPSLTSSSPSLSFEGFQKHLSRPLFI